MNLRRLFLTGLGPLSVLVGAVSLYVVVDPSTIVSPPSPDVQPPPGWIAPIHEYEPNRWPNQYTVGSNVGLEGLPDYGTIGKEINQSVSLPARHPTFIDCGAPLTGRKCIQFNGDDSLDASQINNVERPFTLALVARSDLSGTHVFFDGRDNSNPFRAGVDNLGRLFVQSPTLLKTDTERMTANEYSYVCFEAGLSDTKITLDDLPPVALSTGNNGLLLGLTMGATGGNQFNLNGDIAIASIVKGEQPCDELREARFAYTFPELNLNQGVRYEQDCSRIADLCPVGECNVLIMGDSIQEGVNPIIANDGRRGSFEAFFADNEETDCYTRTNRAQSASVTTDWQSVQWDTRNPNTEIDLLVVGGANNDTVRNLPTCTNIQTIVNDAFLAGVPKALIFAAHPVAGRSNAGGPYTASNEANRIAINQCLSNFADTDPNVYFLGLDGTILDDGATPPGIPALFQHIPPATGVPDFLHFNPAGESAFGLLIKDIIE